MESMVEVSYKISKAWVIFGLIYKPGLFGVFAALKLLGMIEWDWLWVLAPIWVDYLLGLGIYLGKAAFLGLVILKLRWQIGS